MLALSVFANFVLHKLRKVTSLLIQKYKDPLWIWIWWKRHPENLKEIMDLNMISWPWEWISIGKLGIMTQLNDQVILYQKK